MLKKILLGSSLVLVPLAIYMFWGYQHTAVDNDLVKSKPATDNVQGSQSLTTISDSVKTESAVAAIQDDDLKVQDTVATNSEQYISDPRNIPDPNPDFESLQQRLDEMSSRRAGVDFDAEAVQQVTQQADLWVERKLPPTGTPLTEAELNDGRPFVEVNPLKVESLMPGDTFSLYIPQTNETLELHVEQVKQKRNTVTWNGSLKIDDTVSLFTMSKGPSLIVGGIETPYTHYSFEVYGNVGWIEESGKLFKHESEPLVPPGEGHAH